MQDMWVEITDKEKKNFQLLLIFALGTDSQGSVKMELHLVKSAL